MLKPIDFGYLSRVACKVKVYFVCYSIWIGNFYDVSVTIYWFIVWTDVDDDDDKIDRMVGRLQVLDQTIPYIN